MSRNPNDGDNKTSPTTKAIDAIHRIYILVVVYTR